MKYELFVIGILSVVLVLVSGFFYLFKLKADTAILNCHQTVVKLEQER